MNRGLGIKGIVCAAPAAKPCTLTADFPTPEPTLDLFGCSTIICCRDCSSIPVHRVIAGNTFASSNLRIRLFGVDTPERGV